MIRRLIILLLIVGCGTEPEDCAGVEGGDATLAECEALGDMASLQDIINLNNLYPSDSPFYEPAEIGEQTWNTGRITSLDLSNWSLDTLPSSISNFTALTNLNFKNNNISMLPDNISSLTALTYLNLSNNNLTTLPNTICDIYDSLSTLYLKNNYICPPYPECITDADLDHQFQGECESMGCMDNTACNYNEITLYSYLYDTCWYPDVGCIDCANAKRDCLGICGGTAELDCAGICNGNHILIGCFFYETVCVPEGTNSFDVCP